MLKNINIQNFQSHESTKLEFDKGVNIIVGSSDCGKSAIIRALRWVIYNKPVGDAFRSTWGGDTFVTARMDNTFIKRYKGSSNGYKMWEKGQKKKSTYEAIKGDVPQEIQDVLNMDEANIQSQMDSPFLLSNTPGEVARHFNSIAHLDKIDSSLKNAEGFVRTATRKVAEAKTDIEVREKTVEQFKFINTAEDKIVVLETLQVELDEMRKAKSTLNKLINSLEQYNTALKRFDVLDPFEKRVDSILSLMTEAAQIREEGKALKIRIVSIRNLNLQLQKKEKYSEEIPAIDKALSLMKEVTILRNEYNTMTAHVELMETRTEAWDILSANIQKNEKIFTTNFPSSCPLCGTEIKHKHGKN